MMTHTPRCRLFGVAMIVAPLLLLASTALSVTGDGLGEDRTGGVLQVYAMIGFILAVIGLTRIAETHFARVAAALTLVGVMGTAGGVAYGINSIYVTLGTVNLNDVEGLAGLLALKVPGLLFPLTFIGLGALFVRAGVQPRWSGVAMILGGLLFPISRIASIDMLAPLPDALLLFGLAPIGLALLRDGTLSSGSVETTDAVLQAPA